LVQPRQQQIPRELGRATVEGGRGGEVEFRLGPFRDQPGRARVRDAVAQVGDQALPRLFHRVVDFMARINRARGGRRKEFVVGHGASRH
jgi:hypothetical protein